MPDYLTMVGALMVVFLVIVVGTCLVFMCFELIDYCRRKLSEN